MVGGIVIFIVATAWMTSTTYVQFLKGALLFVFSTVLVVMLVIIGPASVPGGRVNKANIKLDVMGFDARTGKKVWTFHTIPRKGEFGYDTWLNGCLPEHRSRDERHLRRPSPW